MKRIGFIVLVSWVMGNAGLWAQTPQAALVAAEAKFKALTSFSATVGYVIGDHRDMGKVYYKGDKYQLDFPEDFTVFDGKVTMNWSKEFAVINYPEPGAGPDLSIAGLYGIHRFGYQFEWIDSAATIQRMRLTPNEGALIPAVTIGLDRRSGLIDSYTVALREDLDMQMLVLDYALNPELDDKLFVIDWDFVKRVENGEVAPVEHEH